MTRALVDGQERWDAWGVPERTADVPFVRTLGVGRGRTRVRGLGRRVTTVVVGEDIGCSTMVGAGGRGWGPVAEER